MFVDDSDDEQATVCISFPSQFVSSDEIAINSNRTPVPTVQHGQGDAPYLVSCTTYSRCPLNPYPFWSTYFHFMAGTELCTRKLLHILVGYLV